MLTSVRSFVFGVFSRSLSLFFFKHKLKKNMDDDNIDDLIDAIESAGFSSSSSSSSSSTSSSSNSLKQNKIMPSGKENKPSNPIDTKNNNNKARQPDELDELLNDISIDNHSPVSKKIPISNYNNGNNGSNPISQPILMTTAITTVSTTNLKLYNNSAHPTTGLKLSLDNKNYSNGANGKHIKKCQCVYIAGPEVDRGRATALEIKLAKKKRC